MSALISSIEHSLATAASDTVKAAKFVETSVLPVLKKAQADASPPEDLKAQFWPLVPALPAATSRALRPAG
jgi:hypothetical protein